MLKRFNSTFKRVNRYRPRSVQASKSLHSISLQTGNIKWGIVSELRIMKRVGERKRFRVRQELWSAPQRLLEDSFRRNLVSLTGYS